MTTAETVNEVQPVVSAQRKTSFSGDVFKLVSGTTIAQVLGVLITPFLARLYAPEAFGLLAVFVSITNIVGVIVCLRYELAIVLPESDDEAINLLGVSLGFAGLISLLMVPAIIWGGKPLLGLLNAPNLLAYLWLVPPMVLVSGVFLALNYWNSRTKRFGRLSIARIVNSVATYLIKLGAGYTGYIAGSSLIGATVAGQTIATIILGGQIWRDDRSLFLRSVNWRKMLSSIRLHRRFPLYSTWSALINAISWQLPTFLLSAFFSTSVVGYYALGFRLLQMPTNLIGSAIGQVFFQRAAQAKIDGTLTDIVETVLRLLVKISVFPFLILAIIGKDLFMLVFGAEWAEAGIYTQILSMWAILWFTSSPLSTVVVVFQRQDIEFRLSFLSFLMRLGALIIGGFLADAQLAIFLFALSGVLVYGYLCFIVIRMVMIPWKHTVWIYGREFLSFLPFGIGLTILSVVTDIVWIKFAFASIAIVWYLVRLISDPKFKGIMRPNVVTKGL